MTRALVVDDEPHIVRALVINLKARKYGVDSAHDGASALEPAAARPPTWWCSTWDCPTAAVSSG